MTRDFKSHAKELARYISRHPTEMPLCFRLASLTINADYTTREMDLLERCVRKLLRRLA
jgi:hypothetical protein